MSVPCTFLSLVMLSVPCTFLSHLMSVPCTFLSHLMSVPCTFLSHVMSVLCTFLSLVMSFPAHFSIHRMNFYLKNVHDRTLITHSQECTGRNITYLCPPPLFLSHVMSVLVHSSPSSTPVCSFHMYVMSVPVHSF